MYRCPTQRSGREMTTKMLLMREIANVNAQAETMMMKKWRWTTKTIPPGEVCSFDVIWLIIFAHTCYHSTCTRATNRETTLYKSPSRSYRWCSIGLVPTVSDQPLSLYNRVLIYALPRYQGFLSTHVTQSPTPNSTGVKTKMAHVVYETPELASVAKEALDGFTLKKGWKMAVTYT